MNAFEKTLQELAKEGAMPRLEAIAYLRHFKWEQLTARQILEVLKLIHEDIKHD